ncbi:uncharacterized protein LAESUDRAFT_716501 [Laetiporus sulphureus 93-53]|uniref:Uncharacterized protein n=1 Tax=Laetiporus sulphureus 93-53 TaxID=1314785 RepID=A0A165CJ93_9APHY|nr:uncharacterized protein LAESUDRAFT_716501 [Laetiporus sulphureus 93-53]KZT02910.1 hypothetical protein LAESUDRAFT_716501 [Laetiporus sulphureus 93-53]
MWKRECARSFPVFRFDIGYFVYWWQGQLVTANRASNMSLPSVPPSPTTAEPFKISVGLGVAAVVMAIRVQHMLQLSALHMQKANIDDELLCGEKEFCELRQEMTAVNLQVKKEAVLQRDRLSTMKKQIGKLIGSR